MTESSETTSTGRELVQESPPETAEDVIGVVVKTDAAKRQARRSSRLVEYEQVYKGDFIIDWNDDSSSSKEENKDMTLMVVETSSEAALNASSSSVNGEDVSTITDTAAESSLFTYATSSKQTHTASLEDNAPKHAAIAAVAAANFLETIRESVLLFASNNNEKDHSSYTDALHDHGLINAIPSSTSTTATTTTSYTAKSTSEQPSDIITKDHRLSTETFSTQPESNESSLVAVSLPEEMQQKERKREEEETYPTTSTPISTTGTYINQNTVISKLVNNDRDPNYSIYPIVVIHNDDDQVSVCSSACSISTHSTMSTHMVTQPSYHDVERSLIKEEHSPKAQPSQIKVITSFACFPNEAFWKALLIGCFFGLTLGAIVIFSTLIARIDIDQ
eukprot:CAMPEP_0172420218 /NCGR_PEP_ID=MMETSP1064-20121228/6618_1 /TAXON_ID=202472 /ORGANISM="Aulacoseira subarctica , Strain CCAP 1002/5" /LENGTH=390 /DNA_ID=CAMNT_0013160089 /DNA_START=17 /DNA_END=1187 /DNA_ORIENTATION=+